MATQDDAGVPVTYDHDQQGLRLLELPAALFDVLTSDHPPKLHLKSAQPPTTPGVRSSAPHAVLCTHNQTYQLRQVQTSNSVFVLTTSQLQRAADRPPLDSLCATATCSSTLELQQQAPPEPGKTKSPRECIAEALAVYDADVERLGISRRTASKHNIFADVPYSDGECEAAWTELMAFEYRGSCFRPSGKTAAELWSCLFQHMTAQGHNFSEMPKSDALRAAVADDGYPLPLLDALCKHISRVHPDGTTELDAEKLVPWLGGAILDTQAETGEDADLWQTVEWWKSALPEQWREMVSPSDVVALREARRQSNGGGPANDKESLLPAQNSGAVKRPGSRNWHEKFKRARR